MNQIFAAATARPPRPAVRAVSAAAAEGRGRRRGPGGQRLRLPLRAELGLSDAGAAEIDGLAGVASPRVTWSACRTSVGGGSTLAGSGRLGTAPMGLEFRRLSRRSRKGGACGGRRHRRPA